jgi:hypothetical protein
MHGVELTTLQMKFMMNYFVSYCVISFIVNLLNRQNGDNNCTFYSSVIFNKITSIIMSYPTYFLLYLCMIKVIRFNSSLFTRLSSRTTLIATIIRNDKEKVKVIQ